MTPLASDSRDLAACSNIAYLAADNLGGEGRLPRPEGPEHDTPRAGVEPRALASFTRVGTLPA